ncbi:RNA 2',3'-cyclic phosphodiesterase [Candidatus Woesearchaeota archaeon CG10_big_fil_rev_8_21_14_0_10_34_8]|nr:MAG: RNA 2',3'-cyclic phosphodiesterase [Candidatus Woesearchaeota archaeon CG10_big_fil_rev_8_21_14_0_10_34_8]
MRTFLSIKILDKLKDKIQLLQKRLLKDGIKLVEKNNLHITLKFLGEINEAKLKQTKELLKNIKFKPFKIQLKDIGVFPNKNYVRVIWIDCKSDELIYLGRQINTILKSLFRPETFTAHLTIARVRRKIDLKEFLEKECYIGEFECSSFELMKSELTPNGPVYYVMQSYKK